MDRGRSQGVLVREWFVGCCAYALLVAPFGCQFQGLLLDGGGGGGGDLTTSSTGFFVDDGSSGGVLAAGRNVAGDAFFVYGTGSAETGIQKIDSILVRTAAGAESYILFELGRPTFVQGADGSYIRISYDSVAPLRLEATVEVFSASGAATDTYPVVIDLTQTAEQVAAWVEQVTGKTLEVPEVSAAAAPKTDQQALGLVASIGLTALFVVPVIALVEVSIIVLGQVLTHLAEIVSAALEATLLVALSPLFLVSELLGDVVIEIELVGLPEVFVTLPDPPGV